MEINVRTAWSQYLQNVKNHERPFELLPFTTLNEKLGILPTLGPIADKYPITQFFAVGNGGHTYEIGEANIPIPILYQHRADDAALFKQQPFVVRQINNDLAPAQRARYALREERLIRGVLYAIYWLRRIIMTDVRPTLKYRNINAGVTSSSDFIPTSANLSPVPRVASSAGVNLTSGDYVTCTSSLPIVMTAEDIEEYLNAAEILQGDRRLGIISEMALCAGYDHQLAITGSSGNYQFTDAKCVQVMNFISAMHLPMYSAGIIEKRLDVGSNNPLYNVSPLATTV